MLMLLTIYIPHQIYIQNVENSMLQYVINSQNVLITHSKTLKVHLKPANINKTFKQYTTKLITHLNVLNAQCTRPTRT